MGGGNFIFRLANDHFRLANSVNQLPFITASPMGKQTAGSFKPAAGSFAATHSPGG